MKKVGVLSVLALLGAAIAVNAPPAAATDISFESRTYVPARGTDGENTHVLLYEYLTLDAENLVQPGIYLRFGGWGRADLADETYGQKTNSELQYAFLGWRAPQLNAEVRVGRISLTAGVARHEVFDGVLLGSDLPAGFDVTLFGGIPVEVEEDGRSSDMLYGGRVSQGRAGLYRLGASYLKQQNDGEDGREEAGVDLFLAPLPLVEVTGTSLYNVADEKWARHDYRLVLGPFAKMVRLTTTWVVHRLHRLLHGTDEPRHAADRRHEGRPVRRRARVRPRPRFHPDRRICLVLRPRRKMKATAACTAAGSTGPVRAPRPGPATGRCAARPRRTATGSWTRTARRRSGRFASRPSAEHVVYEAEINGETNSTTGKLGLSYAASKSLDLSASVEYGQTPEYDSEVKGFLAMTWRYDASIKKGGTK